MPFEVETERVLEVLRQPIDAFHSTVAATVEQVGGSIEALRANEQGNDDPKGAHLGRFAAGRIDPGRFAALLADSQPSNVVGTQTIEKAHAVLSGLAEHLGDLTVLHVNAGGSLQVAVADRLAEMGRAFGAARVVQLSRSGRYQEAEHGRWLEAFPFRQWNSAERQRAAPLVVEVSGSDLYAGGLAEFLDGEQKIVLVVRGACPPAPLACLITPGVFVQQTADPQALERLVACSGPAIAAVLPENAASFCHDPDGGTEPSTRITIDHEPDEKEIRRPVGGISVAQQIEGLRHLMALAKRPAEVPAAVGPSMVPRVEGPRLGQDTEVTEVASSTSDASDVDRLAAWLLSNTDLEKLD